MKALVLAAFSLVVVTSVPALALEAVCSLGNAKLVPEIEALNKLQLEADYDGLFAALHPVMPSVEKADFAQLKEVTPGKFESCSTIAQREDVGGLVQEIVLFKQPDFLFAVYWRFTLHDGKFELLTFYGNTNFDKIFDRLH